MHSTVRLLTLTVATSAAVALGGPAVAAPNPAGTGQPDASCEEVSQTPAGFASSGFDHAGTVYAGSDGTASALHAGSAHAVSQYDIACYQLSRR